MSKINVEINPQLEFMNSILLTSKFNAITTPMFGYGLMSNNENNYTNSIKNHFLEYNKHPVYKLIESLISHGFFFGRPVELMLSLNNSEAFNIEFGISETCIEYSGGIEKINSILDGLKDLYLKSEYREFFTQHSNFYTLLIDKVYKHIQSYPFVELIENQYGIQQNSYNYVLSSLMVGNLGISFYNKKIDKYDLFCVFTTENISDDAEQNEFNRGALSANVVFHEFSHPFINPLTKKYIEIVNRYHSTYEYLAKYKLPNYRSGYGDWEECINEHLVRAMAIHLLKKCNKQEWAKKYLEDDLCCGYKYIPAILEKYEYYDKNRDRYKTFEEFYPTLVNIFSERV